MNLRRGFAKKVVATETAKVLAETAIGEGFTRKAVARKAAKVLLKRTTAMGFAKKVVVNGAAKAVARQIILLTRRVYYAIKGGLLSLPRKR